MESALPLSNLCKCTLPCMHSLHACLHACKQCMDSACTVHALSLRFLSPLSSAPAAAPCQPLVLTAVHTFMLCRNVCTRPCLAAWSGAAAGPPLHAPSALQYHATTAAAALGEPLIALAQSDGITLRSVGRVRGQPLLPCHLKHMHACFSHTFRPLARNKPSLLVLPHPSFGALPNAQSRRPRADPQGPLHAHQSLLQVANPPVYHS